MLLTLLLVCQVSVSTAQSQQDYEGVIREITLTIRADGSILFQHEREAPGSYQPKMYNQYILMDNASQIDSLSVWVGPDEFRQSRSLSEVNQFMLQEDGWTTRLGIRVAPLNEQHFIIKRYIVSGAVHSDGNWAEAENITIGRPLPHDGSADILVRFENPPRAEDFFVYASEGVFKPDVTWDGDFFRFSVSPSEYVQVLSIVFPASSVPDVQVEDFPRDPHSVETRKGEAFDDLESYREAWESSSDNSSFAAIFLLLLSLILSWYLVRKPAAWKEIQQKAPQDLDTPPAKLPPAIAGALISMRKIMSHHLSATILDLASRGYYSLSWQNYTSKGMIIEREKRSLIIHKTEKSRDDESLRNWEKQVLTYVDHKIGDNKITPRNIFPNNRMESRIFYTNWKRELIDDLGQTDWFKSNYGRSFAVIGLQLLVILIANLNPGITGIYPSGVIQIIAGIGIIIAFATMIGFSDKGWKAHVIWKAYLDTLENGRAKVDQSLLGTHLKYIIAMVPKESTQKKLLDPYSNIESLLDWFSVETEPGESSAELLIKSTRELTHAISRIGASKDPVHNAQRRQAGMNTGFGGIRKK